MNTYKSVSFGTKMCVVGPGGPNCPCCTMGPKRDLKPLIRRTVRRVMKQELHRESYEVDKAA